MAELSHYRVGTEIPIFAFLPCCTSCDNTPLLGKMGRLGSKGQVIELFLNMREDTRHTRENVGSSRLGLDLQIAG